MNPVREILVFGVLREVDARSEDCTGGLAWASVSDVGAVFSKADCKVSPGLSFRLPVILSSSSVENESVYCVLGVIRLL